MEVDVHYVPYPQEKHTRIPEAPCHVRHLELSEGRPVVRCDGYGNRHNHLMLGPVDSEHAVDFYGRCPRHGELSLRIVGLK